MKCVLRKSGFRLLITAALAAAACSVSAAAATAKQDGATPHQGSAAHSTTHKKNSTTHSSSGAPTKSSSTTTTKSPVSGTKSARSKSSSRKKSKRVRGQEAPTADRINEIQDALAAKGAFTGTPTGKWDDSTAAAMKKFQSSNGLPPTGKLDALSLQKLGLGSQTAGLAAPTAPPNSVNRLRNQSSSPAEPPVDPVTEPRN